MQEMDEHRRRVQRRHQAAKGERKIGNRQTGAGVPHEGAQNKLHVDHPRGDSRQHDQARLRGFRPAGPLLPTRPRAHRQRYGQTEKRLRQAGVADRYRRRQQPQHRDAAEQPLQHHRQHRGAGDPLQPRPRFPTGHHDHQRNGQHADNGRRHAMAVLVQHAADHRWEYLPEGQRPIGHCQAGARAGNGSTDGDEQQRGDHQRHRQAVHPAGRRRQRH